MNSVNVAGRGALVASWELLADGSVVIRLDDVRAAEFWAEVCIPQSLLLTMLGQQHGLRVPDRCRSCDYVGVPDYSCRKCGEKMRA